MTSYGITGGIGSGKSFVCKMLEARGCKIFYCDDVAKTLIRHDEGLRKRLKRLVGNELYADDGTLQKSVLSAFICKSREQAEAVDAMVHPRVREAYRDWESRQRDAGEDRIYMECALLFEAGFDDLVDKTVLVYSDEAERIRHVMQRDGIGEQKARSWMSLQMPEDEKRRRADIVIGNDYSSPPDISEIIQNNNPNK